MTQDHPTTACQKNRYRIVVIEWLSFRAIVEAGSPEEAQAIAGEMFADGGSEDFVFSDSGLDSITADEMAD